MCHRMSLLYKDIQRIKSQRRENTRGEWISDHLVIALGLAHGTYKKKESEDTITFNSPLEKLHPQMSFILAAIC